MSSLQQYNVNYELTAVEAYSSSNVAGTYTNGTLNNGVGATFIPSSSPLIIDGITIAAGNSVVLAGQTSTFQNGIYLCTEDQITGTSIILQRRSDFQSKEQILAGQFIPVSYGAVYGATFVMVNSPLPNNIGIDPIVFNTAVSASVVTLTSSNPAYTGDTFNVQTTLTVPHASGLGAGIDSIYTLNGSSGGVDDASRGEVLLNTATYSGTGSMANGVVGIVQVPTGQTATINGYGVNGVLGIFSSPGTIVPTSLASVSCLGAKNSSSSTIGQLLNFMGSATYLFSCDAASATYYLTAGVSLGSAGNPTHCAAQKVFRVSVAGAPVYVPAFTQNT